MVVSRFSGWALGAVAAPRAWPWSAWSGAPASDDDAELVVAARHGDDDAFDELVRRHAARLHAVARRLVGVAHAEDAVQDCLFAAYRSLSTFRGDARFATYLHAILVRQCRRRVRRDARAAPWPEIDPPSPRPGPGDHAERAELHRQVRRAVAGLPPRFREAIVLREAAGLDYAEIARALGVPIGTVRSRLARARERLREALERAGATP